MNNPFPEQVRKEAWTLLRPYKNVKFVLGDVVALPPGVNMIIGRWSVKFESVLGRLFGSDHWAP